MRRKAETGAGFFIPCAIHSMACDVCVCCFRVGIENYRGGTTINNVEVEIRERYTTHWLCSGSSSGDDGWLSSASRTTMEGFERIVQYVLLPIENMYVQSSCRACLHCFTSCCGLVYLVATLQQQCAEEPVERATTTQLFLLSNDRK